MLVWRCEDEVGLGPFDSYSVSGDLQWYHEPPEFPMPAQEGLVAIEGDYCGCQSPYLFDRWWPRRFWKTLAEASNNHLGRAIFLIDDDLVRSARMQCIFPRRAASRISFITFDVLLLKPQGADQWQSELQSQPTA